MDNKVPLRLTEIYSTQSNGAINPYIYTLKDKPIDLIEDKAGHSLTSMCIYDVESQYSLNSSLGGTILRFTDEEGIDKLCVAAIEANFKQDGHGNRQYLELKPHHYNYPRPIVTVYDKPDTIEDVCLVDQQGEIATLKGVSLAEYPCLTAYSKNNGNEFACTLYRINVHPRQVTHYKKMVTTGMPIKTLQISGKKEVEALIEFVPFTQHCSLTAPGQNTIILGGDPELRIPEANIP